MPIICICRNLSESDINEIIREHETCSHLMYCFTEKVGKPQCGKCTKEIQMLINDKKDEKKSNI